MEIYTSNELQRASGLSPQQLHRLARRGLLKPSVAGASGRGSRRLYSEEDVRAATILGRVHRLRLKRSVVERVVCALRDADSGRHAGVVGDESKAWLVTAQELLAAFAAGRVLWAIPLRRERARNL